MTTAVQGLGSAVGDFLAGLARISHSPSAGRAEGLFFRAGAFRQKCLERGGPPSEI